MARGPIQVVLNTNEYIEPAPTRVGGGRNKDFYYGRNDEFVTHRMNLVREVSEVGQVFMDNPYSAIGYAKVRLIKAAWAKSHRPENALFNDRHHCRIVGGMRRGELLVEMDGRHVGSLVQVMNGAEIEDRWTTNREGERVLSPSRARSEVGAIEHIAPITGEDRCSISPQAMADWVQNRFGCLIVELFNMPRESNRGLSAEESRLYDSFRHGLESIVGLQVGKVMIKDADALTMTIRSNAPTRISFTGPIHREEIDEPCADMNKYDNLIQFLRTHPLVKSVSLSPSIQSLLSSHRYDGTEHIDILTRDGDNYPIVGVVDNGISNVFSDWTINRCTFIDPTDRDENHGSFISGLLVNGKALNASICKEEDGCLLADICVLPKDGRWDAYYFYDHFSDFLGVIEDSVRDAVESTGVRVFNFSMNIDSAPRGINDYGYIAKKLDELATELDVVFVISAGNLGQHGEPFRNMWNADPVANVTEIQSRHDDIATEPAESIRNISVGALNPDAVGLACYSRKGKASELAVKPDFVYPSGSGMNVAGIGEGLYSVDKNGMMVSKSGTSFSAPQVAKTLAILAHSIEGQVSRETLLALLYHSAEVPEAFNHKAYKPVLEEMIGYGMPQCSADILDGNDHSITLVFSENIRKGMILTFPFAWPRSLVKNGKCFGNVKMTIVSTPNVDHRFGSECVRENVGAHLRIDTPTGKKDIMEILYREHNSTDAGYEWELIEQEHKWNPVKVYERNIKRGIVNPGQFYLEVDYLSRTSEQISPDGVPFTVILTISDNNGEAPVYEEMRSAIIANGAQISDIRTAARITPRV